MKRVISRTAIVLLAASVLSSCTKKSQDTVTTPAGNGKVKIEFTNKVGSSNLNLNTQWYMNEHGDSFVVSKFIYYISNIKLTGPAGIYTEAESYHLVTAGNAASMSFDLTGVPAGQYTGITYLLGVDSLRNVSGAQTGALDPTNGMFWTWNTGYIMWKFEGTSPRSTQSQGQITYHGGGFTGADNALREVTMPFPQTVTVAKDGENHVHIGTNVQALFNAPNQIDFAQSPVATLQGKTTSLMADNFVKAFTITYAGL